MKTKKKKQKSKLKHGEKDQFKQYICAIETISILSLLIKHCFSKHEYFIIGKIKKMGVQKWKVSFVSFLIANFYQPVDSFHCLLQN